MKYHRLREVPTGREVILCDLRLTCPVCGLVNSYHHAIGFALPFDYNYPDQRGFHLKNILADKPIISCKCLLKPLSENPYVLLSAETALDN